MIFCHLLLGVIDLDDLLVLDSDHVTASVLLALLACVPSWYDFLSFFSLTTRIFLAGVEDPRREFFQSGILSCLAVGLESFSSWTQQPLVIVLLDACLVKLEDCLVRFVDCLFKFVEYLVRLEDCLVRLEDCLVLLEVMLEGCLVMLEDCLVKLEDGLVRLDGLGFI